MNEETFLSALRESPDDEVTWLALADWLEEDGQSERAELVRIVRRLRALPGRKRTKARAQLESRIIALLEQGVRPAVAESVNSIGMRFALIPPGRFRMGSPRNERTRSADEVAHEVAITRPFSLGVVPVTQRQYERVMGSNPSYFRPAGEGSGSVAGLDTGDFPVETTSWLDAVEFCERLSKSAAEASAGRSYRLPTEAQWEYACRAGISSRYPWGEGMAAAAAFANYRRDGGPDRPSVVGSYRPNAFGLYDMQGNVWEWCHDWYQPKYYERSPRADPRGPRSGEGRICRGSAFDDSGETKCRSACRLYGSANGRYRFVGFRVALDVAREGLRGA
jgi:uncharacterized protein (TIGR02996 family)